MIHPANMRASQRRKLYRKPRLPVTVHHPRRGTKLWTFDGQGYVWHEKSGSLIRINDVAPDGYLEARRKEHDALHRAFREQREQAKQRRAA